MPDLFPILDASLNARAARTAGLTRLVIALPWGMIAPHAAQAKANHGWPLETLAEAGGLNPYHAVCVLEDRPCEPGPIGSDQVCNVAAMGMLSALLAAYDRSVRGPPACGQIWRERDTPHLWTVKGIEWDTHPARAPGKVILAGDFDSRERREVPMLEFKRDYDFVGEAGSRAAREAV